MHRHLIAGAVRDAATGKRVLVVAAGQDERRETFAHLTQHAETHHMTDLHVVTRTVGDEGLRFRSGGRVTLVTVRAAQHFGAARGQHFDVVIVDDRELADHPERRAALLGEIVPVGAEIIGLEPWLLFGGAS